MFHVLYQMIFRKSQNENKGGNTGKKSCSNCGKKINSDYKYCFYCGIEQKQHSCTHKDMKNNNNT